MLPGVESASRVGVGVGVSVGTMTTGAVREGLKLIQLGRRSTECIAVASSSSSQSYSGTWADMNVMKMLKKMSIAIIVCIFNVCFCVNVNCELCL
jgi:hypothetical protein